MANPIDQRVATALHSYVVVAILAVLVGALVAPFAAGLVSGGAQYVAVVHVDETISDSTAGSTVHALNQLRRNDSVKAVVLDVSSPGGGAAASESMFLAVERLAREKPVYASVDSMAASGAYYTILPSREIYVKPGSLVGHVGVIATAPSDGLRNVVATGPDKAHGGMTPDEFRASVETMKRGFVGSVMAERGDRLSIPRTEVAKAKAFVGAHAVQVGYADHVGGLEATVSAAAAAAGLDHYAVTERDPAQPRGLIVLSGGSGSARAGNLTRRAPGPFDYAGVETVHYLMLYGVPEGQSVVYRSAAPGGGTADG